MSEERTEVYKPPFSNQEWFKLPPSLRQQWWGETDFSKHPPSADFMKKIMAHLGKEWSDEMEKLQEFMAVLQRAKFAFGARVRKKKRKPESSSWHGHVCGFYINPQTNEIGCNVESERETGSVQIYPESMLELIPDGE